MRQLGIVIIFLFALKFSYSNIDRKEKSFSSHAFFENLLSKANILYETHNYSEAIEVYEHVLQDGNVKKAPILKKIALSHAALYNPTESINYIEEYLSYDFKPSFLMNNGFSSIQNEKEFTDLSDKYVPKFTIWSFMYLYVALIGFYIAAILNFNKKVDAVARALISSFIFIHSVFILHIYLNMTNYQYQFPHSYRMSTGFSFLYGPLLYLYFKRITLGYKFKKIDLLHLLPTLLFLIYLTPDYLMSSNQKLAIFMNRISDGRSFSDVAIIALKLTSLLAYGCYIRKLYLKSKKNKELNRENRRWQKNIYIIHISYVISYLVYGILLANSMTFGVLFHIQISCMALMVMYIGYSANIQPNVFSGSFSYNRLFYKYEKSGLTKSLSHELKENLINLFDNEKIYKENNICLETLADKLNTTRHNTSQVINEHFKMSFHELINSYRIHEAKKILNSDIKKNLHIIDIAYEVGYNNKVTFNKAFKKDTKLTPSEYQRVSSVNA